MGVLSMFAGPICQAIINAAPDIQEALTTVVTMLCEVIKSSAGPIVEAFDALVRAVIPECWQLAKDGLVVSLVFRKHGANCSAASEMP